MIEEIPEVVVIEFSVVEHVPNREIVFNVNEAREKRGTQSGAERIFREFAELKDALFMSFRDLGRTLLSYRKVAVGYAARMRGSLCMVVVGVVVAASCVGALVSTGKVADTRVSSHVAARQPPSTLFRRSRWR